MSRIGTVSHSPATDINNDGRMDLWVSNDTVADFLFVNRGKGKFEEIGETAGVAYSESGRVRSGMGPQPGGELERITDLPIDRYITIVEGTGKWK